MATRPDDKSAPDATISGEEATLDAPPVEHAATASISAEERAIAQRQVVRLADGEVVAGRYRIVRYLARGGMGEVYEALDLELDVRVALKTIRSETHDAVAEERFKREIQLSRKVTHSNVCRIFDVGFHRQGGGDAVVFLTMELLVGETLLDRVRREGPLPLADAALLVRQIAAALTAAHAVGVVHRDLKSGNVILVDRKEGGQKAIVTDFGLAHVLGGSDDQRSLSGSGGIVGTPGYMAPEQVEGGPLSPRTDLYALGVVMYEMLTGKLPFEGTTPLSIATKRLTTPPPSPRRLRPDLPPRWERAILACLARQSSARPASPRAVLELLEEDGRSTSLRFGKLRRRMPIVRPLLAVAAVSLVVVVWLQRGTQRLAAELHDRGVTLGAFESREVEPLPGYGAVLRNALRTDLAFDLPVIDVRAELRTADGRVMALGHARPRLKGQEPLRVEGDFKVTGDGADRRVEVTLRLFDPRTNEVRLQIVENGALRHLEDVVLHLGDRLRAAAGVESAPRAPTSAAGRAALDEAREALRSFELARALDRVEQGLLEDRGSVELRYLLGRVLAGLEMDVSSMVAVRRAVALGPSEDTFTRRRLEALRLRLDASRSAQHLEALHEDYPHDLDLAFDLVLVFTQAQRMADAEHLLDDLIREAVAPRDRLRLDLMRLIFSERRSDPIGINRDYPGVRERARDLRLTGVEAAVLRVACSNHSAYLETERATIVCNELRTLGDRVNQPAMVVAAELGLLGSRVAYEVFDGAVERARGLRQMAMQLGGRRRLTDALNVYAITAMDKETPDADPVLFREALAIARDAHDHEAAAVALLDIGYYAAEQGRMDDALHAYREVIELARDIGSQRTRRIALCRLGSLQVDEGSLLAARRSYDEAMTISGPIAAQAYDEDCDTLSGELAEESGELDEALRIFRKVGRIQAAQHRGPLERGFRERECEIYYEGHRYREMLSCLGEVEALARKAEEHALVKLTSVTRAIALAGLGRLNDARAVVPASIRDRDDSESKLTRARLDLLLSDLDLRTGVPFAEVSTRLDGAVGAELAAGRRRLAYAGRVLRAGLFLRDRRRAEALAEARAVETDARGDGMLRIADEAHRIASAAGGR